MTLWWDNCLGVSPFMSGPRQECWKRVVICKALCSYRDRLWGAGPFLTLLLNWRVGWPHFLSQTSDTGAATCTHGDGDTVGLRLSYVTTKNLHFLPNQWPQCTSPTKWNTVDKDLEEKLSAQSAKLPCPWERIKLQEGWKFTKMFRACGPQKASHDRQ